MKVENWNPLVFLACGGTMGLIIGTALGHCAYTSAGAPTDPSGGVWALIDGLKSWQTLLSVFVASLVAGITIRITLRQNRVNRAVAHHKILSDATDLLEEEVRQLAVIDKHHAEILGLVLNYPEKGWDQKNIDEWHDKITEQAVRMRAAVAEMSRFELRNPAGSPTFDTRTSCVSSLFSAARVSDRAKRDAIAFVEWDVSESTMKGRKEMVHRIVMDAFGYGRTHSRSLQTIIERNRASLRSLEVLVSD